MRTPLFSPLTAQAKVFHSSYTTSTFLTFINKSNVFFFFFNYLQLHLMLCNVHEIIWFLLVHFHCSSYQQSFPHLPHIFLPFDVNKTKKQSFSCSRETRMCKVFCPCAENLLTFTTRSHWRLLSQNPYLYRKPHHVTNLKVLFVK